MFSRPSITASMALLSLTSSVLAAETLLYEDFQDGRVDGWRAYGDGLVGITEYEGNSSLRMTGGAMVVRQVSSPSLLRFRIGASFAASGLGADDACIAEVTLDDGKTWLEFLRIVDGQDDSTTLHAGRETRSMLAGNARLWVRARVEGDTPGEVCWLDDVFIVGEPSAAATAKQPGTRVLSSAFLLGEKELTEPVSMLEFTRPGFAATPDSAFSGALRLIGTEGTGRLKVVHDAWNRADDIGEPVRHLPEFDFQFVQHGEDIVPLQRGVQRSRHPYWEIILQPGKAWNEPGDGEWVRISVPFSLQERSANCTHNGVMTWLHDGNSEVSRVTYQISSETCGYFKFDMWGVAQAEYRQQNLQQQSTGHIARLGAHRQRRLPIRPIGRLATDYPGMEPMSFGVDDGINPADMTVFGLVVDGIHYRSACNTRHGPYPYCTSLPLPSYSTAKSMFAGIAAMRLEKLYPGISETRISALVDGCSEKRWRDVTIENALDMATGIYSSRVPSEDEDSAKHVRFIFSDNHAEKIAAACNLFDRRSKPGKNFVYHTSDTYLVGTALQNALSNQQSAGADLYTDVLVLPIWRRLGLSPLLDDTKRTYDEEGRAFTGYGLTYESDDIVRLAGWLANAHGTFGDERFLDQKLLDASLQREPADRGLPAGSDRLRYNNGFWAFDAAPTIGCGRPVWVPFMSGVSGITVAMFPNGVIYYYFSDSYVFRWRSARLAANSIRDLCK